MKLIRFLGAVADLTIPVAIGVVVYLLFKYVK